MRSKYIEKIRSSITIKTSRKTSQLLNGLHRSVYKGKSLDFDNLREYTINDDIRDVDWKSSIRHGGLLVRQYIAERRHNILFIMDSNLAMDGETESGARKHEVALMSAGTLAYIASENGDSVGFLSVGSNDKIMLQKFGNGSNYIDLGLQRIEKFINQESKYAANDLLAYVNRRMSRKLISFVVTDINGLDSIEEQEIKKSIINHELFFIMINDGSMCNEDAYDLSEKQYVPKFISSFKKLKQVEQEARREILEEKRSMFKKYGIQMTIIDNQSEIVEKIIDLLERHNHAVTN